MPSDLFHRALHTLSEAERLAFERWAEWAQAHAGVSAAEPTQGDQIVTNVRSEAHLVGEEAFGDPHELSSFLRSCAAQMARPADGAERHQGYVETCQEHSGHGLRIPREHLPAELLRYVDSERLAATLVERMLGKRARDLFSSGAFPAEVASTRLHDHWDSARLEGSDRLGRSERVFATFEHAGGAPRHDATALSQALALKCWQGRPGRGPEILVELAYPADRAKNPRFPTVADADWTDLFRPAAEEVPRADHPPSCCGWTAPLGGHPPQPEIVHDNAALAVVSKPPRFLKASR